MKIDLNKPFLDLDDTEIKNDKGETQYLNKLLANNFMAPGNDNVLKFFDWGIQLWKTGIIDVDRTDTEIIKKYIENLEGVSRLFKGRMLNEFIKPSTKK